MLTNYHRYLSLALLLTLIPFSLTSMSNIDNHSIIDRFVGEYQVTSQVWSRDGQSQTIESAMINTRINDNYIFSLLLTQNPHDSSHPLTKLGILAFDPHTNQYKNVWIGGSALSTRQTLAVYSGEATEDSLTLYNLQDTEKAWTKRNHVEFTDDGNFNAVVTVRADDGQEHIIITAEFTRVERPSMP